MCFLTVIFSQKSIGKGKNLNWDTGLSKIQDRLKYIPLSCPCPLCAPNPYLPGEHKTRKTYEWACTTIYVCFTVISSGVSHNLNMNFNCISSLLRGNVTFWVPINYSNAWWQSGICMATTWNLHGKLIRTILQQIYLLLPHPLNFFVCLFLWSILSIQSQIIT